MIELSNIIHKNEKVGKFYLYGSNVYGQEAESSESLYMKILRRREGHLSISWVELPHKSSYEIYFQTLVNEYGYSLNEYPKSYIDKIIEKDEFIKLTKTFS